MATLPPVVLAGTWLPERGAAGLTDGLGDGLGDRLGNGLGVAVARPAAGPVVPPFAPGRVLEVVVTRSLAPGPAGVAEARGRGGGDVAGPVSADVGVDPGTIAAAGLAVVVAGTVAAARLGVLAGATAAGASVARVGS